jgi:hypothetical protein
MRMMRAFVPAVLLSIPSAAYAVDSQGAMFVGGTVSEVKPKTEGQAIVTDPDAYEFVAKKGGGKIRIPWKNIDTIEYGQNASRRIKSAILLSPLALFHKARKHMVSLSYKDEQGVDQAIVLEIGKNNYRTSLAALKAKSGKVVACQDEDAAKQMGGGCAVLPPADEAKK